MIHDGRQSFEKREHPRAYLKVLTFMNPSFSKASILSGWIHSLSRGGIGVSAKIPSSFKEMLQEGDEVEFIVYEEYSKFHGVGKIEWISTAGGMMGIKFKQLSQENKMAVDQLLRLFFGPKLNQ